jgi:aspartate aminotransferase
VVVTNGGKQAIYQALAAIIDPGDEVLLPAPYWTTYPEAITLAGGVAVEVFAGVDQNYRVTVDQLEASRSAETKAVIFVSPSNPTGSVYSASETRAIGEWALRHDIWVISDEIYQNLTYDGVRALSILDVVPALSDQCILVNGVAKTYAMTGWRVGWLIGPEDVVRAVTNLQSNLTSHVSNISQMAATAALNGPAETIDRMRSAFDRRRRLIVEGLNGIDGIICPTPEGAFYVYADVAGLFGRSFGGVTPRSSLELADLILEKADVAVVPGEAFGRSGYLRFSYALADESIVEGLRRLRLLLA